MNNPLQNNFQAKEQRISKSIRITVNLENMIKQEVLDHKKNGIRISESDVINSALTNYFNIINRKS